MSRRPSPVAFIAVLAMATGLASTACRAKPEASAARNWLHCTCSYISDFDEPGRASIDVCSDGDHGGGTAEVAAACARNDGVGIPTRCECDKAPRGACTNDDRCRSADPKPP